MTDIKRQLTKSVLDIALELGRTPSRAEFEARIKGGRYQLQKQFGSYAELLKAAGLATYDERRKDQEITEKFLKKYKSICSRKEQIQGFFRHIVDLEALFARAGNPDVIKISGMPDTHVKFRDKKAVSSYLKFLEWYKPDVHLIFGDFMDCEGLSHWPDSSLEPRRIVPEAKEGRELLRQLVAATPSASTRIFLEGNHENWIQQALGRMPELFEGLEDLGIEVSVKSLLRLVDFGYEFFPVNHLVKIGNAHFTHGIYHGTHHAKKHLDVFKASVFYGHLHDNQTHNQTSVQGNMEAASNGCLCRLDAKFLKGKPNNWTQGHGVWEVFRDGTFIRYFVPIIDGRSSFGGVLFDGND